MHREPDVGFDPGSPGSRPGPKAGAKPLRHPGIPENYFFQTLCIYKVRAWIRMTEFAHAVLRLQRAAFTVFQARSPGGAFAYKMILKVWTVFIWNEGSMTKTAWKLLFLDCRRDAPMRGPPVLLGTESAALRPQLGQGWESGSLRSCRPPRPLMYRLGTGKSPLNSPRSYSLLRNVLLA